MMRRRLAGLLVLVLLAGCASGRIQIRREPDRAVPGETYLRGTVEDPGAIDGYVILDGRPVRAEAILLRSGTLRVDIRSGSDWAGLAVDLEIPPQGEEGRAWVLQWRSQPAYSWGRSRRRIWAREGGLILVRHDPTVPGGQTAGLFSLETSVGRVEGAFAIAKVRPESVLDLPRDVPGGTQGP